MRGLGSVCYVFAVLLRRHHGTCVPAKLPRVRSPDRHDALSQFVKATLKARAFELAPASADASFRSYWRATDGAASWIVMDAPPQQEDVETWLDVDARLRIAGLHAPEVHAVDVDQGFV